MSLVDVGRADDVPEGRFEIVSMGGRQVGLTRWRDHLYAVLNVCPHQRGPLCHGSLLPELTAARPGSIDFGDAAPVISCPWHGWEFELASGAAVPDGRYRARTFPVSVRDGRVLVELPD